MDFDNQKMMLIMELRRLGVTDMSVLEALEKVPREKFVLTEYLDIAYANQPLPIGLGQTISQPLVVGALLPPTLR